MWHRLQVLITKKQKEWLKAESYTTGKSIGEIVRNLIDAAMLRRNKEHKSRNSTGQE